MTLKRPLVKIRRAPIRDIVPIEEKEEDLMVDSEISGEDLGTEKEEAVVLLRGIPVQWDHLFPMKEWVVAGEEEWAVTWEEEWAVTWEEWVEAWVTLWMAQ